MPELQSGKLGPAGMGNVPTRVFLTKGVGKHREKLASFEHALRNAGIAHCNIVRVSSIFPPRAKLISPKKGIPLLKPGQIVFAVMADISSNEPRRLMAASIGVAIPRDRSKYGYLAEHHAFGQTGRKAGEYAEDLAAGMLASTLGIPFDADRNYDEQLEEFKLGKMLVRTLNCTQSAVVDSRGRWTTALAAAVLL